MTQSDRVARTRNRVLDHAEALFLRNGFSRVGMEEVADRAGTGKATVFRHFGSKNALFDAVMDRYFHRVEQRVASVLDERDSNVDKMKMLFVQLASELTRLGDGFWDDLKRYRNDRYRSAVAFRRHLVDHYVGTIVERGQQTGEFRDDIPRSVVTTLILAAIERLSTAPVEEVATYTYGEIVEMIVSIAVFGIVRTR